MLDAFIIDAIRREEFERELERENRIRLDLPQIPLRAPQSDGEDGDPVVIPLYPEDDAEDTAA
jgi:hypothetical protein